jgi:hypothetical protein
MAFYDKFPYTNFQELNLDWLISEVGNVHNEALDAAASAEEAAANAISWHWSIWTSLA